MRVAGERPCNMMCSGIRLSGPEVVTRAADSSGQVRQAWTGGRIVRTVQGNGRSGDGILMTKTLTAVILALSLAAPPLAVAQAEPTTRQYSEPCFTVSVSPNPVRAGSNLNVSGSGAAPNTSGSVSIGSQSASFNVGGNGRFGATVSAPSTPGVYQLQVTAACTGYPSSVTDSLAVTVIAPGQPPGRPRNVAAFRSDNAVPTARTPRFVTVTWDRPTTGGVATAFVVQYRRLSRGGAWSAWRSFETTSGTICVESLGPRKRRFSVLATNGYGVSRRSNVVELPG